MDNKKPAEVILLYASSLAVLLYSACVKLISACKVILATREVSRLPQSIPSFVLALLICYVAEAATLVVATLLHQVPAQAHVFQVLLHVIIWFVLIGKKSPRSLYLGVASISLVFSIVLLIHRAPQNLRDPVAHVLVGLHVSQVLLQTAILIETLRTLTRKRSSDAEREALLPDGSVVKPLSTCRTDAAIDTGEEDDNKGENDQYIKGRQRQRLQESGSWWAYLKAFKIFLPYLIPSWQDHQVILCIFTTVLCLLASTALNLLEPRQLGIVTNSLISGGLPFKELVLWLLMTLLYSICGLDLARGLAQIPINQFSYRRITTAAFDHVMQLSMDFHNDKDSAEIMKAVEQGTSLNNLLEMCITTIAPSCVNLVIGYIYFWQVFDGYMSSLVLIASVSYVYLDITTSKWNVKNRRQYSQAAREEFTVMHQPVNCWQTVSYFNRFDYENTRFAEAIDTFQSASQNYQRRNFFLSGSMKLLRSLTFFSVCCLAIFRISIGKATVGDFVFLISFWNALIAPLTYLSTYYRWLSADLIDAERLLALFQTKPTITDQEGAKSLQVSCGKVTLKDVAFSYDHRKAILRDINIVAYPGHTLALVGETGGEKSTLLKLLYRFYDVTDGAILIDGQDIREVTLSSLRDAFGVVPQDPILFNISLMENLRYARLDASKEEVYEACKAAAIHEKIKSFPDGYQTKVGERGVKLTGGELQRIAIAQVLLKKPRIVLLDEATSSVDTDTENVIQKTFRELSVGRTTFVIAHRLSTIVNADKILVIHEGRIIEQGTHRELINFKGKYHSLWSKQVANSLSQTAEDEVPEAIAEPGNQKLEDLDVTVTDRGDVTKVVEDI